VDILKKKKATILSIRELEIPKVERDSKIRGFCTQLRRIKKDLLGMRDPGYTCVSDPQYHSWIRVHSPLVVPEKVSYAKDNLVYDLKCHPQDYFSCMVYMMEQVEVAEGPLLNVFPLRTSLVPKHICLDTATLVRLLIPKGECIKSLPKSKLLAGGNLKRFQDDIWRFFFRTDLPCFRNRTNSFHHMIETDGVSCSILFSREEIVCKKQSTMETDVVEYIDQVSDYTHLRGKKIVGIDPGLNNLLFCVDADGKGRNHLRYTMDMRRSQSKTKKFGNILLRLKTESIEGKTVFELETELSEHNSKTLDFDGFKKYLKKKNEMNSVLFKFYQKPVFRRLGLNGFFNRLKSEQSFMNKFKNIFGGPEQCIIFVGNYSKTGHMKFKEPTKGKGFRELFRRYGYQLFLVDEFRTSCRCSRCGEVCSMFTEHRNPKPMRSNITRVRGALKCQKCNTMYNRDDNGARNIYKIAINAINSKERPSYLSRSETVSDDQSIEVQSTNE